MLQTIVGIDNTLDAIFCQDLIEQGTIVTLQENDIVRKYKKGDTAYGVSLHTVVHIDDPDFRPWSPNTALQGGRIHVIRTGQIFINLGQKQVTINHPLYINAKTAKLTTKVGGKRVGRTLSNSDPNGWCKVEVNFR